MTKDIFIPANGQDKNRDESHNPATPQSDNAGEAQIVNIEIFKKSYTIKSDRPELVTLLANMVKEEAEQISKNSQSQLSTQDLAVQVAFHLSLSLYKCQNELKSLSESTKKAEARLDELTGLIENLLNRKP